MLDRISAELTRSADALLDQQLRVLGYYPGSGHFTLGNRGSWVGLPVIVTTARLFVCRFDPAIVPLTNGLLPEGVGQWEEVTYIRYRKSFDAPARAEAGDLGELEKQSQRTIAIVRATHLVDWLGDFVITKASQN